MLEDIDTKEKVAHSSYKGMGQLDFQIMLTGSYYVNPNSIHLRFPMKIKRSSNKSSDIDLALITVNNFFWSPRKRNKYNKVGAPQTASTDIFSLRNLPVL